MNKNPTQSEKFKAKQYGAEDGNPRNQNLENTPAAWSIRNKLRHLASQEADPSDKDALRNIITKNDTRLPTIAETIAAAILMRASSGNIKAANCAIENIEGKLAQAINHGGQADNPLPNGIIQVELVPAKPQPE